MLGRQDEPSSAALDLSDFEFERRKIDLAAGGKLGDGFGGAAGFGHLSLQVRSPQPRRPSARRSSSRPSATTPRRPALPAAAASRLASAALCLTLPGGATLQAGA